MNFLTDNFLTNFFSSSNKSHEELNTFVNKKFTFFLNNSNLLLNFVSDFEDYKKDNTQTNKSKCNECEDLYILTSDIFEQYFNKINIPYNIDVTNNSTENPTSKTNYKNKVLYFFDIKDLKKILNSENLEKSNPDLTVFNKKRLLCKIISLSFINIYIIVKSIYQTFNIYDTLIEDKNNNQQTEMSYTNEYGSAPASIPQEPVPVPEPVLPEPVPDPPEPVPDPVPVPPAPVLQEPVPPAPVIQEPVPPAPVPQEPVPVPEPVPQEPVPPAPVIQEPVPPAPVPQEPVPPAPVIQEPVIQAPVPQEPAPVSQIQPITDAQLQKGGGVFKDIFSKLIGSKTETNKPPIIDTPPDIIYNDPPSSSSSADINGKLQTSSNIFYSIFVLLFANSTHELFSTNFNTKFLNDALDKMTNETLSKKIPEIVKYICERNIYSKDYIGRSSLLFRNDNFKFMKLETSNNEQLAAQMFIDQIDKDNGDLDRFIEKKRKLFEKTLTSESIELLFKYCKKEHYLTFANYKLFTSIKDNLKIMIKNYFKTRTALYNNIIKELFVFDSKSHDIISLNSKLTYKSIVDINKKTKIILLDLHITVFTSLNTILSDIANEINVMKPIDDDTNESTTTTSSIGTEEIDMTFIKDENKLPLKGGKTKKHRKKKRTRSRSKSRTK